MRMTNPRERPKKGEQTCRYSVFSSVQGCIESRCLGLREARRIGREHKSRTKAMIEIWQWDVMHEMRPKYHSHLVESF